MAISDAYYVCMGRGSCLEEYRLDAIRTGTGSTILCVTLGSLRVLSLLEMPCTDADLLI